MIEAPQFFVPLATPSNQESVYESLAMRCGKEVPNVESQIYSITYIQYEEEWTATVGESLQGKRLCIYDSKGNMIEPETPVSDPSIVLAIFAGSPYK